MFFFKSKGPVVKDVVFLNAQGYTNAISRWVGEHGDGVVAVWFQSDTEQLRALLTGVDPGRIIQADRLGFSHGENRTILFAGHHPLRKREADLCEELGLSEMLVYTHLDMPLLRYFGSEKISEMMVKMGMNEDEPLTHVMITKAIAGAQDKIAKTCIADMNSLSEDEWIKMNVTAGG